MLFGKVPMLTGPLKSLLPLWENLATNHRYGSLVTKRDITTFRNRSENEGLSFLTIVLPRIGKALDKFHSTHEWEPPSNFKLDEAGIPVFLGPVILLALKGNSLAVDCVRQLSYMFYKLEVDYDEALVGSYLDRFVSTDLELPNAIRLEGNDLSSYLIAEMRKIVTRILCNVDPRDIRPNHGSGATACRTKPQEKWHKLRYFPKLDAVYPYSDFFFYNYTHLTDEYKRLEESSESSPRARVVTVPKDSRGPRIISCEPAELMYIQQGIMKLLYNTLETHHLTSGLINFKSQEINRRLAHQSSIDGSMATLDLSDASDRVSLDLVRLVFPDNWVECLEACRSEETILPDGRIVKFNKFAPMGSACCFPVEALIFWSCAMATCTLMNRKESKVYVYGDDIICPADLAGYVIAGLEEVGLKVNRDKSYVDGPFRESCGGDYHNGFDVTPIRVRKVLDSSHTSRVAYADFINLMINKFGYDDCISAIDHIERTVQYVYPRSELQLPLVIHSPSRAMNDVFFRRRWNKDLQRYEHHILQTRTKKLKLGSPSWCELLRKELSIGYSSADPLLSSDSTRVGEYAVPHSVCSKWEWSWLG